MTEPDTIDSTAVEEPVPDQPTTELARRDRTEEVLKPVDAGDLLASFQAYQELLPRLLTPGDYQQAERGKRFVKKSGWRKIARAFRLNCEVVRLDVERDSDGMPVRASAVVRATAPNGDFQEGDGHCSIHESRFTGRGSDQARKKAENDLPATAVTRAKNRAISDLVGMGEVSAEEAGAYTQEEPQPAVPAWALPATRDQVVAAGEALQRHGLDRDTRLALWQLVRAAAVGDDEMPAAVAIAVAVLATKLDAKAGE